MYGHASDSPNVRLTLSSVRTALRGNQTSVHISTLQRSSTLVLQKRNGFFKGEMMQAVRELSAKARGSGDFICSTIRAVIDKCPHRLFWPVIPLDGMRSGTFTLCLSNNIIWKIFLSVKNYSFSDLAERAASPAQTAASPGQDRGAVWHSKERSRGCEAPQLSEEVTSPPFSPWQCLKFTQGQRWLVALGYEQLFWSCAAAERHLSVVLRWKCQKDSVPMSSTLLEDFWCLVWL